MDTVLNLGMNDDSVQGLAELTGNPRFAWDSYRRFIQMYANVVMGINTSYLEATLEELKEARGVQLDTELTADDLSSILSEFTATVTSFPLGLSAVDKSDNNNAKLSFLVSVSTGSQSISTPSRL